MSNLLEQVDTFQTDEECDDQDDFCLIYSDQEEIINDILFVCYFLSELLLQSVCSLRRVFEQLSCKFYVL